MIEQFYITQLEKRYAGYLKAVVREEPFQAIVLRGGKNKPATTADLHQLIKLFQANEKTQHNKGWNIEWEDWFSKKLGKQQWPAEIKVTSESDFLYLIKKEKEVVAFKKQLELLLRWNANIRPWLANKTKLVLELQYAWDGVCSVVDYLLNNEVAGYYLRSIPLSVHTKFIEQHKRVIHSILHRLNSERFSSLDIDLEQALLINTKPFLFTLRWLDENLSIKYTAGMTVCAVPVNYLQSQSWSIDRIILVENETNLYLFPPLTGTLVICSYGKALHLLKEIEFLNRTKLYYWGDMDQEGFVMLNDVRNHYRHIISLFMDDQTLAHHQRELANRSGHYKQIELPWLEPHEIRAYDLLLNTNEWLEQERLQQSYIQDRLIDIFKREIN
jgi:hypothetical protein